jgi:hypothetical protein
MLDRSQTKGGQAWLKQLQRYDVDGDGSIGEIKYLEIRSWLIILEVVTNLCDFLYGN